MSTEDSHAHEQVLRIHEGFTRTAARVKDIDQSPVPVLHENPVLFASNYELFLWWFPKRHRGNNGGIRGGEGGRLFGHFPP